ncbi:hypothetical protein ScPMuIL_003968 [Solemya velum]
MIQTFWKSWGGGIFAIDCYVCESLGGANELCEDKFQRGVNTYEFIDRECEFMYFKANFCIKLKGKRADGSSILVRQCSRRDWGTHCGDIRYLVGEREERIQGCLESCDFDGCNSSQGLRSTLTFLLPLIVTAVGVVYKSVW